MTGMINFYYMYMYLTKSWRLYNCECSTAQGAPKTTETSGSWYFLSSLADPEISVSKDCSRAPETTHERTHSRVAS